MRKSENNWKRLTLSFSDKMKDALQQQHHAAQYLALVGRHLIPQQPDDSNTNMEFIPETGMLVGNPLSNGLKLGLQLADLQLKVLDEVNRSLKTISLEGKTKKQGFAELKDSLYSLGIDITSFSDELHYEIPKHPLDEGAFFTVNNKACFTENLKYRYNARLILSEIASTIKNAEPVKIWPHHFDTGSFVSFAKNEKGAVSQTIGLGFAIPDSMVTEPYFYLSFWSEKTGKEPSFSPVDSGKWMMPVWNGAVLALSEILKQTSAKGQYNLVKTFYEQGISEIKEFLGNQQ